MATEAGSRPRRSRGFWLALGCAAVSLTLLGCVLVAVFVAATGEPSPTPTAPIAVRTTADYADTVRSQVLLLQESLQRASDLVDSPQPDSAEWRTALRTEARTWQLAYSVARDLDPPPDYDQFHRAYLAALSEFDAAADGVLDWTETGDEERLAQVSGHLARGSELLSEARAYWPE